jgi:DNA-binding NarL/FixJ family response regulator
MWPKTVYIIRHAEKPEDPHDPNLSPQGVERAHALATNREKLFGNLDCLDGINSAKEIRTFLPEVPILFFSMHDSVYLVHEAKMAGGQGFVNKTDARATLLDAVDALAKKETYFPDRGASTRTV